MSLSRVVNAADAGGAVEGLIVADEGFAMIGGKGGDPVVVFSQTRAEGDELAIDVGGSGGDAGMEGMDFPARQPGKRRGGVGEQDGYFRRANNGGANGGDAMGGQKRRGRTALPAALFLEKIAEKRGVGDHGRDDRRPRLAK